MIDMKKLFPFSIIVVMIATVGIACQSFSSGKIIIETKSFDIPTFTALTVAGPFEVHFTQSDNTSAKVEASASDLENIEMEVKDNELVIKTKKNSNIKNVVVYLSTPALSEIGIAGSGKFMTTNTITSSKTMQFEIAGSGIITATIDAQDIKSEIAGSGDIHLSGRSANSEIEIAGSGNYKAEDLTTGNSSVEIAGSGSAYVNASGKLSAEIAGSGSIYYKGQPTDIDKEVAGSGRVKQMD